MSIAVMSKSSFIALMLILALTGLVHAEVDLSIGGKLQTDLRFRSETQSVGAYYHRLELPSGVSRNENIFTLRLDAAAGPFSGVAELDVVYYGYAQALDGLGDLSRRESVDPFRIEAHALYIQATDLGLEGLDLRVGQQQIFWGKGDQFNPTNTLNPLDLEDPLLFGEQLANMMVRLDYMPWMDWTLSGVLVPIFKPALVPDSAPLGIAVTERMPVTADDVRYKLQVENAFTEQALGYPMVVTRANPVLPERSLDNMQWALRLAGIIGEQDIALSYYWGRTDMPQPYLNFTRATDGHQCDSADASRCINGLLQTEVFLGYPRVQVVGLNMAGQVDALGWISDRIEPVGYRLELGLFVPQEASIIILQEQLNLGGFNRPAGEYDYNLGGERPVVVEDTPFAKWVVGLDYTFGAHVYANVQWVHGFPDEFGAGDFITEGWSVRQARVPDVQQPAALNCVLSGQNCERLVTEILRPRLGDYLVLGVDIKLLQTKLLLRLFSIWDLSGVHEESWDSTRQRRSRTHHSMLTSEGFSAVIFPEATYNLGHGFELGAGALLMLGKSHTKFGDPASGGSQIFTRARYRF